MKLAATAFWIAAILTVSTVQGREWKDVTGSYTVEADLVSCNEGLVQLKRPDGSVISVPLEQLSAHDREYATLLSGQPPTTRELTLAELVSAIEPAVVRINTITGLGSGFVVKPSGIVITNFHVVEGSGAATVSFKDGRSVKVAGYLGVNIEKDIAILKLEDAAGPLPFLRLSNGLPEKGSPVAAFGAPQGLDFSVSNGIVSAIRTDSDYQRSIREISGITQRAVDMMWVQTTAAISGGNSGGPLVDMQGQVVGINTKTRTAGQNLNFAVSCQDIAGLLTESFGNPVQNLANLPRAAAPSPVIPAGSSAKGFPLVRLPSGTSLSYMNVQVPKDWPDCNITKEAGVRRLDYPNGEPKHLHAFLNGQLHGPCLVLNEDGSKRWASDYYQGNRHGALRHWGPDSEMVLFAEFSRGRKNGFVCLFHESLPTLIQEWEQNQKSGEYFVRWNAGVATVLSPDKHPTQLNDSGFALALERLAELEKTFDTEELEIKRDLIGWFRELDNQIKRQRAAQLNIKRRGAMLGAIAERGANQKSLIGQMWRRTLNK